ncbi:bacteriophage T4 gp5 trimerisation domain-containing protein, partial [Pseudomonas paraveronii]
QTVPYDLPENATQSGMKSRSSKGGTPANFNEIRMEDKKGLEQLYIHAERNQDIVVEVDESHSVGHDRNKSIGHDEVVTIGNDRVRAVKHDDMLMVGFSKTDAISQSYLIEVGQNLRLVCGKSVLELNASGQINLTGVQINVYSEGNTEINTGGNLHLNIGGKAGTTPMGQGVKGEIDAAVNSMFPNPPPNQ